MTEKLSVPEHDEVESFVEPPSEEPGDPSLDISLSLPEKIEIRMVEASALADYEIWFFVSSCVFALSTSFWVAWFQEQAGRSSNILIVVAGIFSGLFVLCFLMALKKRRMMTRRYRSYLLKAQRIERYSPRRSKEQS